MGEHLQGAPDSPSAELLNPAGAGPNPAYAAMLEEARRIVAWMWENGYGPPAGYQPPVEEPPVEEPPASEPPASEPAEPEPVVIDLGVPWDVWVPPVHGPWTELPLLPDNVELIVVDNLATAYDFITIAYNPAPLAALPEALHPAFQFQFDPRKILVGDSGPTDGNDVLTGGAGADTLAGLDGFDWLYGYDGDDVLFGQGGNDEISGGEGNDLIFGGNGDVTAVDPGRPADGLSGFDYLYGLDGDDAIWGGDMEDRLYGGSGDDTLVGNDFSDKLWGGDGDDYLFGGNAGGPADNGADELHGGEGNDALWGEDANDALFGGADHDYIDGGAGADSLNGGTGDDTLIGGGNDDWLRGDGGYDNLYGGAGADVFVFKTEPQGDYVYESKRIGDGYFMWSFVNVDHVWDFSAADGDKLRFEGYPGTFDQFKNALSEFMYDGVNYTFIEYTRLIYPVGGPGEGVVMPIYGGIDRITVKGMSKADWTESMVEFAPDGVTTGGHAPLIAVPYDPTIPIPFDPTPYI